MNRCGYDYPLRRPLLRGKDSLDYQKANEDGVNWLSTGHVIGSGWGGSQPGCRRRRRNLERISRLRKSAESRNNQPFRHVVAWGDAGQTGVIAQMLLRIALAVSLIAQLAWSMPCCGLVVLRLDFTPDDCALATTEECDEFDVCCSAGGSCCPMEMESDDRDSTPADTSSKTAQPACFLCIPLDHKKLDRAAGTDLPPMTLIAHAPPPAARTCQTVARLSLRHGPARWTTSRQRQSLLAVWTI